MSGDLEDFLRRAAQRRQAKAAEQPAAATPAPRQRPQYTNHRTERITRDEVDEVMTAELVDDGINEFQERMRRLDEAKRAAAAAEAEAAEKLRKLGGSRATVTGGPRRMGGPIALTGNPAQDLVAMLQRPGGIAQAILLREILERPEHRW